MLAIGTRFSELETARWSLRLPGDLIQIDVDAEQIGRNYPVSEGIVSDAKLALGGDDRCGRVGRGLARGSLLFLAPWQRTSGLSRRRVHYGFGNVGLESPTQHAESVRHVARTIRNVLSGTAYPGFPIWLL